LSREESLNSDKIDAFASNGAWGGKKKSGRVEEKEPNKNDVKENRRTKERPAGPLQKERTRWGEKEVNSYRGRL